jgi:diguanylate cyclase (GGDEF)-like protein
MIDVDYFKRFNDDFGHDAGDLVLMELGAILRAQTSDAILPARLGGEEFVILCPDMSEDQALALADQLRLEARSLRLVYGTTPLPPVTLSCGVASMPRHGARLDAVLQAADRALYQAKADGRDRSVLADCGRGAK